MVLDKDYRNFERYWKLRAVYRSCAPHRLQVAYEQAFTILKRSLSFSSAIQCVGNSLALKFHASINLRALALVGFSLSAAF